MLENNRPSGYLAHVDGLRTIAVLGVLYAHFGLPGLPGGFLGVDVFFVISGFLITRQIVREKISTGEFNYLRFYHRRVRRLLPAALAVIFLSILIFYPILSSKDLYSFLRSVPFSILPLANMYFYNEVGYFDTAAKVKPLLHYWSLAVEEQFYFLWPTLLLFVIRWPIKSILATGSLLAVSLIGAEWVYSNDISAAYYLLPFRAFELLVGSLLALVQSQLNPNAWARSSRIKGAKGIFASIGVLIIGLSYLVIDESTQVPGLSSLYVCTGTALVIASGAHGVVGRFLTLPFVLWIGLISYSLYLVHWPIFVFVSYIYPYNIPFWLGLLLFPISILVAAGSYYFVEKPLRHPDPEKKSPKNIKTALGILLFAFFLVVPSAHYKLFVANRGTRLEEVTSQKLQTIFYSDTVSGLAVPALFRTSRLQVKEPRSKVLILGDSHSGHLIHGAKLLAESNFQVDLLSVSGCPPLFNVTIQRENDVHPDESCIQAEMDIKRNALEGDYDVIILAARWALATGSTQSSIGPLRHIDYVSTRRSPVGSERSLRHSREVFDRALEDTVRKILDSGKRVVLLGQVPPTGADLTRCQYLITQNYDSSSRCWPLDQKDVHDRLEYSERAFQKLANSSAEVFFFSALPVFCPERSCVSFSRMTGEILYQDDNHLDKAGQYFLFAWFT